MIRRSRRKCYLLLPGDPRRFVFIKGDVVSPTVYRSNGYIQRFCEILLRQQGFLTHDPESGSTCLKNRSLSRRSTTAYHKPIVFSTAFGEKELFVASVRLQRKMRRTRRIPAKMSPSNTSQNRKQHSEKETFAAFFDKTGAGEIVPYAFRMLSGIFVPIPRQDACRDIDIAPGRRYNILWRFS